MSTQVCSFGYLPPKGSFCSDAFKQNLDANPPRHPQILYSDDDWGPEVVRLKMSPEVLKHSTFTSGPHRGQPNPFAIHNGVFMAGLKMCLERGYTHGIYLEQDCRVGCKDWDNIIFEEYFSLPRPVVVAGTISVFNTSNSGVAALKRFYQHFATPPGHGIPTPTYGWFGANAPGPTCAFPNGALAVYDIQWLCSLFNVQDQIAMASQNTAFDMAVGAALWEMFGPDAYEVIGSLGSVYSGYGDVMTTEEMRQELLTSGKVVAVHQIKGNWTP